MPKLASKAAHHVRQDQRVRRRLAPHPETRKPAERARTSFQKRVDPTYRERRQWWIRGDDAPLLPLPDAKVPEQHLAFAKEAAVEAMQEFGVLVEASRASGMGRFQLGSLVRSSSTDPEFRGKIMRARQECIERLESAFVQRGLQKGGDLTGIFFLKHNKRRYQEIQRLELTGKDGVPLDQLGAVRAQILEKLAKLAGSGASGSAGSAGSGEIVIEAGSTGSAEPRGRPKLLKASGDDVQVERAEPRKRSRKA